MDATAALKEFLTSAKALTGTQDTRASFVELLGKVGITVDGDLNLSGTVTEAQLQNLLKALDSMAVLKLSARRIFGSHGLSQ